MNDGNFNRFEKLGDQHSPDPDDEDCPRNLRPGRPCLCPDCGNGTEPPLDANAPCGHCVVCGCDLRDGVCPEGCVQPQEEAL